MNGTTAKVRWSDGNVYNVRVVRVNEDSTTVKVRWLDENMASTKFVTKRLAISRLEQIEVEEAEEETQGMGTIFGEDGEDDDY